MPYWRGVENSCGVVPHRAARQVPNPDGLAWAAEHSAEHGLVTLPAAYYLLPTSLECPSWELGETVTPSPHHPLGCKGVGSRPPSDPPPQW